MKIKPTDKPLSRYEVLKTMRHHIYVCDETLQKWEKFDSAASKASYHFQQMIYFDAPWLPAWLERNEWANAWLVKHGFATEVVEFVPFNIEIRTKEECRNLQNLLGNSGKSMFDPIYLRLCDQNLRKNGFNP